MRYNRVIFRVHAVQRMFGRGIEKDEVLEVLRDGEVIERKPDDLPYPSHLMLGFVDGRPLHVVASDDPVEQATVVITAYAPDPDEWDQWFRRRKP